MRLIKGTALCLTLLLNTSIVNAQDRISILASASGGVSYTGANAYMALGGAYRKHLLYIGPKLVVSRSFLPGKMMWGGNIGYSFSVIETNKWNAFLNADYQLTQYRNTGVLQPNTIHELTGGLGLNYFAVPQRFSIGLKIGSGVHIDKSYNRYNTNNKPTSGMMQQVRLGITYKISKQ